MRLKFGFLVGFGAGYVLGAKAGHDRYDQLQRLYENLLSSPGFQQATGRAREAATTGVSQAKDKATEGASKAKNKATEGASKAKKAIKERRGDEDRAGLSVAPPPQ
jgi:hypothetical protein